MTSPLLICFLYNISSFRRLSSAVPENIVYRACWLLAAGCWQLTSFGAKPVSVTLHSPVFSRLFQQTPKFVTCNTPICSHDAVGRLKTSSARGLCAPDYPFQPVQIDKCRLIPPLRLRLPLPCHPVPYFLDVCRPLSCRLADEACLGHVDGAVVANASEVL